MIRGLILLLLTIPLLIYSIPSLRSPRSHGFFRFFAWEAILALMVLNAPVWFRNPLAVLQMISWLLLLGSIYLAVEGFRLLRQVGKPQGPFENTTKLVEVGAYHYIRHPLYCSLLLLGWGAFFKDISLAGIGLVLGMTVLLYLTARADEAEMLARFGMEYQAYMDRTKRFTPYLF